MTEFETAVIELLTGIKAALEAKAPRVKREADVNLFGEAEDRALRGKKPLVAMPEPFPMTDKHREFAAKYGYSKPDFMFDNFKAHHKAKGSRFALWDSAWQTWVLNQVKFAGNAPQPARPDDGGDGRI